MDADLTAALGTAPTATEKLYAEAIEDGRLRAAELQQYRADMKAMVDRFWTELNKLPPETQTEADRLYQRCILLGAEMRKQSMTTATTQATMLDVINDGIWIGEQLYAHLKAKLGQV
jgi:hypothetical protein